MLWAVRTTVFRRDATGGWDIRTLPPLEQRARSRRPGAGSAEVIELMLRSAARAVSARLALVQFAPRPGAAEIQVCVHPDTGPPDAPLDLATLPVVARAHAVDRPAWVRLGGEADAVTSDLELAMLLVVRLEGADGPAGVVAFGFGSTRMPRHVNVPDLAQQLASRLSRVKPPLDLLDVALVDELSGTAHRSCLHAALERLDPGPVCLAQLDLDRFLQHVDHAGFPSGDATLARLGEALLDGVADSDLVCRSGGDEFTLLLPGRTLPEAVHLVDGLRNAAAVVTASAGVLHIASPDPALRDRYLRAVSDLVTEAKLAGRDRVMAASWPLRDPRAPRLET